MIPALIVLAVLLILAAALITAKLRSVARNGDDDPREPRPPRSE